MKGRIKKARRWLFNHWRGLASGLIIATLAVITLSLQLNSVIDGQNKYETATLTQISTFPDPTYRAVNAPYMIPAYLMGQAVDDPLLGARIVSVIYILLSTAFIFYIIKSWFNIRMATIGSLLFITSSWVLAISHQATPLSLLVLAPLLSMSALVWYLRATKYKTVAFFVLALALGIVAYVPYMLWIIAVSILIIFIFSRGKLHDLKTSQLISASILYFLVLFPLMLSLTKFPGQIKELLGIPFVFPSIAEYLQRSVDTITSLFIYSKELPELHIGTLPILDIFSAGMFLLGFYYFAKRIKNRRSVILFSSLAILFALVPLSPFYQLNMSIMLSLIYIFVIAGVVELLNQWYSFFPRNPWARNTGVVLVVLAIGFSSFYNLSRYYIAWPNTPETKSSYTIVITNNTNP